MKFGDNPVAWAAMTLPLLARVGGTAPAQVIDLMAAISYAMVLVLMLYQNSLVDKAVRKVAQRYENAVTGAEGGHA